MKPTKVWWSLGEFDKIRLFLTYNFWAHPKYTSDKILSRKKFRNFWISFILISRRSPGSLGRDSRENLRDETNLQPLKYPEDSNSRPKASKTAAKKSNPNLYITKPKLVITTNLSTSSCDKPKPFQLSTHKSTNPQHYTQLFTYSSE